MSLLALVRKAQNNDADAMQEIIQRFEPKIRKSLRFTDKALQDDVRQEIALRVIKVIKNYDPEKLENKCNLRKVAP
ncbi:helix-turn-helix domain-containing protein [Brevibacillus laterosporus]|uniref:helix-turn-helix domain-containing protein n=1 Tax=Brevibacillus laterosporus TaxID=1465 RepID=UPI002E2230EE|nr:helix-turn-helix domain-containing protein [Brevibacillus laterosporus]